MKDSIRIRKLRCFLRDIRLAENPLAIYNKCEGWKPAWYDKEYNGCPCIDCSACMARQALFQDNRLKNNLK